LRTELEQLKRVERPRVIEAIAEARAHGDLKENAEYHAAREQQGFIEGRIKDIEGKLSNAQIIDVSQLPRTGKVVFGVTVDVLDVDKDRSTPTSSSATTRPTSSRARSASARPSPAA
jgi:transcription elongation factor GreA